MAPSAKAEIEVHTFVSDIPWQDDQPDCLIVCCSDHRFEQQTRELARNLDFKRPHVLQVPSGAVLTLPLAAAFNFLSKAVDKIIERVVDAKDVREIILVAHEDCGAYKIEKMSLVASALKRFTGKSVKDLQHDHLAQAARRLRLGVRGVHVRAFMASVVDEGEEKRVRFEENPV